MKIMIIKELWSGIDEYKDYSISNYGNVKSLKFGKEKFLSKKEHRDGYLCVSLYKNGKSKMFQIHRLVAMAFLENPNNLPMVNHKDGKKKNNKYWNLEWVDASQNTQHAYDVLGIKGQNGGMNRPVLKMDKFENILNIYDSVTEASIENSVSRGTIKNRINDGEINNSQLGDFIWRYQNAK